VTVSEIALAVGAGASAISITGVSAWLSERATKRRAQDFRLRILDATSSALESSEAAAAAAVAAQAEHRKVLDAQRAERGARAREADRDHDRDRDRDREADRDHDAERDRDADRDQDAERDRDADRDQDQDRDESSPSVQIQIPLEGVSLDREHGTYKVLAEYSAQGLAQSQTSFQASIVFASLGFLVIVTGVIVAIVRKDGARADAIVPIIGGAIVDAVSALFFTINTRAQKVMVEFFDKLRADRRLEEALLLVKGVSDQAMASRLQVLLALQFAEVKDMPTLFQQTIGTREEDSTSVGGVDDKPSEPQLSPTAITSARA
jgi:hypothetical protein